MLKTAIAYPKLIGTVTTDPARLIAQIVSGIGFLGAGTIVITRHFVTGLTTALLYGLQRAWELRSEWDTTKLL